MLAWAALRKAPASTSWIRADVPTPEIAEITRGEVALPLVISPHGRYLALYGLDADGPHDVWPHDLRSGSAVRSQLRRSSFTRVTIWP
jgi:hypothetical protein